MLDQLYGKPSTAWRRTQVFLVLAFWLSRIRAGNRTPPRILFLRRLNRFLTRFTPWQLIVSTLTAIYALKNSDAIFGLQAPEPLARLYSRNYYRATWIVTALDAGFATAMKIRWKWLRDIASLLFAGYYLFFASEADEKLRRYRAVCTVEMLRATWEKTSNPYIKFFTRGDRPKVNIRRRILLERPKGSAYTKPIVAWLYFDGTEAELLQQTELILDLPGGGFICMTPEHHEERTLRWCMKTRRAVLGLDYGKAPEFPFPFAIEEAYDLWKLLHDTKGGVIGMSGKELNVVLCGDSAGANIATAMLVKILETRPRLPLPVSLVFAYPALSFHFTSWMPASDLTVLRQESSANLQSFLRGKDHLEHRSPLSVVEDEKRPKIERRRSSGQSWSKTLSRGLTSPAKLLKSASMIGIQRNEISAEDLADDEGEEYDENKRLSDRVKFSDQLQIEKQSELQKLIERDGNSGQISGPIQTRLSMTSRTAFFNDRIISPSMCRAMALLYIGPRNVPDLHSDYHISPIFTPANLLAQFPPVYMSCGERDPFVDDTVIFAGKIREAKEARKLELLAKENKFGESLRMSGSAAGSRDKILSEEESDWVQMKILAGWSHGYLQMMSLLPEAESAIFMMADWISESFEKFQRAKPISTRSMTAPAKVGQPSVTRQLASEDEDNVLSFTPKKKRSPQPSLGTNSRAASPGPTEPPSNISYALSSGDETNSSATRPRTPETRLSPPSLHLEKPALNPRTVSDEGFSLKSTAPAVAERSSSPLPTNFIDAKDLLRLRRQEAVYGISANNSAAPSDDEKDLPQNSKNKREKASE